MTGICLGKRDTLSGSFCQHYLILMTDDSINSSLLITDNILNLRVFLMTNRAIRAS